MKLLAVSDSHRAQQPLDDLVSAVRARGDIGLCVHLGDVTGDADYLRARLGVQVISVPGNCDHPAPDEPLERVIEPGGVRTLICHGHTLSVKMTFERLLWRAEACGAKMALFGHTHAPLRRDVEGLWLINPGALEDRRYSVITLTGGQVSSVEMLSL